MEIRVSVIIIVVVVIIIIIFIFYLLVKIYINDRYDKTIIMKRMNDKESTEMNQQR